MDVRAFNGSRPEGRPGPQIVQGHVSTQRAAPVSFTDPMWVIVPSHSSDVPYGPLTWPATHGATFPAQGATVTLAFALGLDGTPGVPVVLAWAGIHS